MNRCNRCKQKVDKDDLSPVLAQTQKQSWEEEWCVVCHNGVPWRPGNESGNYEFSVPIDGVWHWYSVLDKE
jgi:hypothetical protein